MSFIKSLDNFLNEGNGLSTQDREDLINYIINNIGRTADEFIMKTAEELGISLKGNSNKKLTKAFWDLDSEDWDQMPPELRKKWIISNHPDLDKTLRGKSFITMLSNNDWVNAKSNIKNFLENQDTLYIKKINEDEEDFIKPVIGYVNKNNRDELIRAIQAGLNSAATETLKDIYQTMVINPAIKSTMEPFEAFMKKLDDVGEEEWGSWTDMSRYLFLANNSPVPIKGIEMKRFFRFLSQGTIKAAKARIPNLLDNQAEKN